MDTKETPLVSICCLTYNHGPYIRQCLEGFMSQKTRFKYEVLIHDDASTDQTPSIIQQYAERYPDIVKPLYEAENQYRKGVKLSETFNFPRAQGKYIALCEGDDYWTDPDKLQKQVDVLEQHPEYSLCCHGNLRLNQNTSQLSSYQSLERSFEFNNEDCLKLIWFFSTLSVVFRSKCLDIPRLSSFTYCRDVHLFYFLLKRGKGYYIDEAMAVYRIHDKGIYNGLKRKDQIMTSVYIYLELYQKEKNDITRKMLATRLRSLSVYYCNRYNIIGAMAVAATVPFLTGPSGLCYYLQSLTKNWKRKFTSLKRSKTSP